MSSSKVTSKGVKSSTINEDVLNNKLTVMINSEDKMSVCSANMCRMMGDIISHPSLSPRRNIIHLII